MACDAFVPCPAPITFRLVTSEVGMKFAEVQQRVAGLDVIYGISMHFVRFRYLLIKTGATNNEYDGCVQKEIAKTSYSIYKRVDQFINIMLIFERCKHVQNLWI